MRMLTSLLLCIALAVPAAAFAGETAEQDKKRVDVAPVDVPEKMIVRPTPEETHQDAPIDQKCSSCHGPNSLDAEIKPLNHFLTTRDCGTCHFNKSWVPLKIYTHLSGRYRPNSDPQDCLACHVSNTEFQAR